MTVMIDITWSPDSQQTEVSITVMQVRKAYKKSALQLHPDKALVQCRFSVKLGSQGLDLASRSEVGPSLPPEASHWQASKGFSFRLGSVPSRHFAQHCRLAVPAHS